MANNLQIKNMTFNKQIILYNSLSYRTANIHSEKVNILLFYTDTIVVAYLFSF